MILDLDGEALLAGIEGRAACHGPGLEHAIHLESEIVMQACRVVLLDDEARVLGLANASLARGLGRLLEVALGAVLRELPRHQALPFMRGPSSFAGTARVLACNASLRVTGR